MTATMQNRYRSFEELPLMLTAEETMRVLGIGRNQTYDLIRSGEIPSKKLGRLIRVPKEGLRPILLGEPDNREEGR